MNRAERDSPRCPSTPFLARNLSHVTVGGEQVNPANRWNGELSSKALIIALPTAVTSSKAFPTQFRPSVGDTNPVAGCAPSRTATVAARFWNGCWRSNGFPMTCWRLSSRARSPGYPLVRRPPTFNGGLRRFAKRVRSRPESAHPFAVPTQSPQNHRPERPQTPGSSLAYYLLPPWRCRSSQSWCGR